MTITRLFIYLFLICLSYTSTFARNAQTKYWTIVHEGMELEEKFTGIPVNYAKLDKIIDEAIDEIAFYYKFIYDVENLSRDNAIKILEIIDKVIRNNGIALGEKVLLLNGALRNGIADCDTCSMIYIAIATILKLPVVTVYKPKHIFIRWKFNNPKIKDINWNANAEANNHIEPETTSREIPLNQFKGIIYCNIGIYFYNKNKIEKAIFFFLKSIKISPYYSIPYLNLGLSFYMRNNLNDAEKALGAFNVALKLFPDYEKTHYLIGKTIEKIKMDILPDEVSELIYHYEQAVNKNPEFEKAQYELGLSLKQRDDGDDLEHAINCFKKVLEINPENKDAKKQLRKAEFRYRVRNFFHSDK